MVLIHRAKLPAFLVVVIIARNACGDACLFVCLSAQWSVQRLVATDVKIICHDLLAGN
jgi:hypothetical protein